MKWVVIAFLIACPFGWMIMARWLNNFAYNSGISPYSFLFTDLIVIAIGLLTIGIRSIRTAMKNPVDVLKYE